MAHHRSQSLYFVQLSNVKSLSPKISVYLFFYFFFRQVDSNVCYCWASGWVHGHKLLCVFYLNSKELRCFKARWWGREEGSYPIKSWFYFACLFSNSLVSPCAIAVVHYDHKYASPRWSAVSRVPEGELFEVNAFTPWATLGGLYAYTCVATELWVSWDFGAHNLETTFMHKWLHPGLCITEGWAVKWQPHSQRNKKTTALPAKLAVEQSVLALDPGYMLKFAKSFIEISSKNRNLSLSICVLN